MNGTDKKILLVEDEPIAQTLYRNRLQREGFQISFAEDGEVALNALNSSRPDLVVLDLMLPKVNGPEMLNRIRSQEQLKNMPILLISNAYMTEMSQKAMESGATRGLLKTECTPARLVETVRDMLGFESAFALSEQLSEDKHMEAFIAAAEGALADEMTLKETREEFIKKSPAEVTRIREHCLAYVKAGETPAGQEPLNQLYREVRFFATRAGLAGCLRTALLANAFEALLFETIFKPAKASPSAPQTFAQAVDCLEHLSNEKGTGIGETIPKAKIMVVDDDAVCNFAVVAALKRAHFEPVSIEDPMKAVEMAKAGHFDIFFLDINMPGMNGFQLCEKLRKMSSYKDTPMIFITANGDFHNRAQSILSGGNDLIPKPISPAELVLKTTMRLVHPQKMWPAKKNGAVTNSAIVNGALTNGSASNGTHAERPAPPSDPHTNGIPEIAMLPFTVPSETEIFRKTSALDLSSTIEPRKPAAPKASVESPQPVEPEKLTLAAEAKDKLAEPVNSEVDTEIKAEGAPTLKVPSLKMSTSERGGESPRIIEPAPAEAKDEIPNALESIKLAMAHAAKEKAIEPAPAEAKAKDEPIKAREAEKLTLAAEVKEKPADPVISEAKADIKSESPKAETVPVVQPEAFPAAMPEKPVPTQTTSETKHSTKTMETNNKPTIDEAARGVARIIFGDENINDMNVRLTRIALERYTAPGKNLDEISRGVAGIIFGDDKLSDMNVRLTRIALERYNITDVLHLNGSSKPEPVLA